MQLELLDSIIRNANDLNRFTQLALDVMYLEANVESFETEPVLLEHFVRQWFADALHRLSPEQLQFRNGVSSPSPARIAPSALQRICKFSLTLRGRKPRKATRSNFRSNLTQRARIFARHEAPTCSADAATLFTLFQSRDLSEHSRPLLHPAQLIVAQPACRTPERLLTLLRSRMMRTTSISHCRLKNTPSV